MKLKKFRLGLILIAGLLAVTLLVNQNTFNSNGSIAAAAEQDEMLVYMPILQREYPPPPPIFGTEAKMWVSDAQLNLADEAGVHWLRTNAFDWDAIEPVRTTPPTYQWNLAKEAKLQAAAAKGMQIIATIRFAPEWARQLPEYACGPIAQGSFPAYAQFLKALVKRYSQPPYNIKYWELGNEPDVDHALVKEFDNVYGCWGDENDEYYGGGYYAAMLKSVYPAIKSADPNAQVLIGGLLLDCDPTNPLPGKDCTPAKFLEGILVNGGGSSFDGVSFHGYPQYLSPEMGGLYLDEHYPSWEARGGIVLGKIDFIREVLSNYGYANKPILHTEGSLICAETNPNCNPPGAHFFESQADYVIWLFVRNWAAGVKATIWYRLEGPGWRYGALLDGSQQPKPAYHALDFLTTELGEAKYSRQVTQFAGLKTYEFTAPDKKVWVLWAPDEQPHNITLPAGFTAVFDKYGADITPAGGQLAVSSPVYVEFGP